MARALRTKADGVGSGAADVLGFIVACAVLVAVAVAVADGDVLFDDSDDSAAHEDSTSVSATDPTRSD